jgi:hypothetical protein
MSSLISQLKAPSKFSAATRPLPHFSEKNPQVSFRETFFSRHKGYRVSSEGVKAPQVQVLQSDVPTFSKNGFKTRFGKIFRDFFGHPSPVFEKSKNLLFHFSTKPKNSLIFFWGRENCSNFLIFKRFPNQC